MKFLTRRRTWPIISLLVLDGLMFGLTDATKVPSFMVIVGFVLLVLTIYQIIRGFISLVKVYGITIRRQRALSVYMTAVLGGLVALQSIGELGSRDVLVLLPLAILGYLYSAYAKTIRRLV